MTLPIPNNYSGRRRLAYSLREFSHLQLNFGTVCMVNNQNVGIVAG